MPRTRWGWFYAVLARSGWPDALLFLTHGDFAADHHAIISVALDGERPDLVEPTGAAPGCRIITKVRHSVFYSTAVDYLLNRLNTQRIVLTGQVSALDGYLRHYDVIVPPDAVAHIDKELGAAALKMMQRNMSAELLPAYRCLR
jgi:nicotinamidase-related amidase